MMDHQIATELHPDQIWGWLADVTDPEIPVISILDLGIVRAVTCSDAGIEVVITPTYSGCPAMHAIEADIRHALSAEGIGEVALRTALSPAWTRPSPAHAATPMPPESP